MKDKCYLVISSKGIVKTTKMQPSLKPEELFIAVDVEVDDSYFKRPIFKATVTLPKKANQETNAANVKMSIEEVVNFVRPEINLKWEEDKNADPTK